MGLTRETSQGSTFVYLFLICLWNRLVLPKWRWAGEIAEEAGESSMGASQKIKLLWVIFVMQPVSWMLDLLHNNQGGEFSQFPHYYQLFFSLLIMWDLCTSLGHPVLIAHQHGYFSLVDKNKYLFTWDRKLMADKIMIPTELNVLTNIFTSLTYRRMTKGLFTGSQVTWKQLCHWKVPLHLCEDSTGSI